MDNPLAEQSDQKPTLTARRRRSRWWLALAGLLYGLGILCILGNLLLLRLSMSQFDDSGVEWGELPWGFKFWEYELRFVAMLVGAAMIYAGYAFARGQWKIGLGFAVGAIVVMFANPVLTRTLRHQISGDKFTIKPPAATQ
jgi:hypothetical protein